MQTSTDGGWARGGSGGGGETWLSFRSILKELQM